jgi:hypothetical protein
MFQIAYLHAYKCLSSCDGHVERVKGYVDKGQLRESPRLGQLMKAESKLNGY